VCREARDGACVRHAEEHSVDSGRHGMQSNGAHDSMQGVERVREAQCTNCEANSCNVLTGENTYCSKCSTTDTEAPIDGVCKTINGDASGCTAQTPPNGTCKSCGDGYFLHKGGCYLQTATPGSNICKTAGSIAGVCEACQAGYFRNPGAAATVDSCISCGDATGVTVGSGGSAKTYKGVDGCKICTISTPATTAACTECATGFLHTPTGSTSCVAECPKGYFGHTSDAQKKTCQSCSSPTSSLTPPVTGIPGCTSCTYIGGDSGTLTCSECNEGKKPSLDGKSCNTCKDTNCASCSSEGACQKCASGYILDGAACTQQTCSTPDCKTCTNPKTADEACTACVSTHYLTPTGQCISDCAILSGYYGDADKTCKRCGVANCETCDAQGQCKTCINGFYLDTKECKACDSSCKSCSGATNADCTECPAGKALTYGSDGTKGTCGEGCVVNAVQASGNCKACDLTVEGTAYCSACATLTEYPQNGVCAPKTQRSPSCNDNSITNGVCTTCADGLLKMNGGCYETTRYPGKSVCTTVASSGGTCQTAAPGYKVENGNLITCPEGCKACNDASTCSECADGYVLTSNACSKCDASCLTCETDATNCKTCTSGYYLSGSTCTSCESNSGGIAGVKGCASCAALSGSTGPVLCYLVGVAPLTPSPHIPVGMSALLLVSQVSPAPCRVRHMVAECPSRQ
ncbi:Variant-specific surface protein, partial [Giardia duodenalis]